MRMRTLQLSLFMHVVICVSSDDKKTTEGDAIASQKFEYVKEEPGNELGIFVKVIADVTREANRTTEEWRLNRAYLPVDVYESLVERCQSDPEQDSQFQWRGCVSDDEGLSAFVTWGTPESKTKTITYLELSFKPFRQKNEKGEEEVCILDEVYKSKAFIVLKTLSEISTNSTVVGYVPEDAPQYQLDSFGENFLSIFDDKIDPFSIYNFGEDQHFDRDPPYECFLSIARSESVQVIKEKCDFFCPEVDPEGLSAEELEKVLLQAKNEADDAEGSESNSDKHDEL